MLYILVGKCATVGCKGLKKRPAEADREFLTSTNAHKKPNKEETKLNKRTA